MKFSYKLVASCSMTIAIIFSLGASLMIYQNHAHLLAATMQEKESSHLVQSYSLESKLIQDAQKQATSYGENTEKMNAQAVYYVKQFASLQYAKQAQYLLYDEENKLLYTSTDASLSKKSSEEQRLDSLFTYQERTYAAYTSSIMVANHTYTFCTLSDISSLYEERTRQYQSFVIIDLCMLGISFLLLYGISTYLTRPIKRLHHASQRIASGHYEDRTQIYTNDEIGELSKSFDEMAQATQGTIEQLKQSSAAKEEFMGSFSHEIKTPMTAILGFADMLRTYDCDEQTRKEASSYIYREAKRLESLSHTLMELLSLSNQPPQLHKQSIEVLCHHLKQHYEGAKKLTRLRFTMEDAIIDTNDDLFFTLMRNLIDNALKASHKEQMVTITGCIQDTHYHICIQDEGIGMSEEDIAKVEQPFYMADRSRSRSEGGAGLGLSIVKRICELHHTKLMIESTLGKGTRISFVLEVIQNEN